MVEIRNLDALSLWKYWRTYRSRSRKKLNNIKNYEKKQAWVRSPGEGLFQSVSFGVRDMEAGICSGQSLGLDFSLCFCWFVALRALLKRSLLWSSCFRLPPCDLPGHGCLRSGQPCSTRGKTGDWKIRPESWLQPLTVAQD